jgi:glycosyltransferase involved in cell wall biosynthesis
VKPVAYVLATFPTLTETFVVGEILELRRRGVPISLYALRESRVALQQPEAQQLVGETYFARALWSARLVGANLRWARRRPMRYLGTLAGLAAASWRNPIHLLKTLFLFPQAVEFADRMVAEGVGHVHAHWATYPTTVALAVSGLTGLPFSFTAHAWDVSLIRTLLTEKVQRARFVITCTDENRRLLGELLPPTERAKVHLNYHGITPERFTPPARIADAAVPVITTCGALFERKGVADLVRACGILAARGRAFRCVIIGDGPQRSHLATLVRTLGLEPSVSLVGGLPQAEVIRRYAETDVFALPCLARAVRLRDEEADAIKALEAWLERKGNVIKDGIPNVLVEAMAMGIPVVSTSLAGIPELIQDGRNGLLVPPRDPERLADALERLLLDPALRRRLGDAGAVDVRARFDRGKNTEALVDIFTTALGGGPRPGRAARSEDDARESAVPATPAWSKGATA